MSVQTRYIKATSTSGSTILNTSSLFKTGSDTSYISKDDGQFQFGRGVDFFTLDFNNGFGNTDRFTDSLGGSAYTNSIVIDWSTWNIVNSTVRAYYNVVNPTDFLANQLNGQPYTRASFTGWYVCNYKEMVNIFNLSLFRNFLDYPPFNYAVNPADSTTRIWTSTMDSASFNYAYNGTAINTSNLSFRHVALLTREFTLTELGL